MSNVKYEYSHELPPDMDGQHFSDGEPILYAYECILLEYDSGKRYIYTIINLKTGGKEVLSCRLTPLTVSEVEKMVERIRLSKVAGASFFQADRPIKQRIGKINAQEIMNSLFRQILPQNGYAVRDEQIALSNRIFETIEKRGILLCEAETGTGKTEGYLIPTVIAKRGRLNDHKNTSVYPGMPYADMTRMPIVIATSSIALQRAILTEYIPRLSQIMLDNGIIKTPLTAVLRKGKENYICRKNLQAHLKFETNLAIRSTLEQLLSPSSSIDLAEIDLTPHVKRKIAVSGRCSDICQFKEGCLYIAFREEVKSTQIDIQVCNQNYLLADTLLRAKGQKPLIPNYQILVIDEAHRFLGVARDMYGTELSEENAVDIHKNVERLKFKREELQLPTYRTVKTLCDESIRLFEKLTVQIETKEETEAETKSVTITSDIVRHIRNLNAVSLRLLVYLRNEAFYCKAVELLAWIHRRYKVDVSPINLRLMFGNIDITNIDKAAQHKQFYSQMIKLNSAICELPDIKRKVALEREQRLAHKYSFNTDNQLAIGQKSNILDAIWKRTKKLLPVESASGSGSDWAVRLIWQVQEFREQATELCAYQNLITWLEQEEDVAKLCAIPNNLNDRLFKDQWSKGIPIILTSGTLSAGGDFTRTKQTLGLDNLGNKLSESTHQSPFNYRDNALLYIPKNLPRPDNQSKAYISAVTKEIKSLIQAAHGHTAVLFTSYDAMGRVYANISNSNPKYQLYRLDKGGGKEIEKFKKSRNGVLFASGSMWEGIDIPGDSLSLLIIVRLPFQVPDAIGEFERNRYANFTDYLNSVIVPEMLIKLKQGFGRLIRTETDSGVVAILDSRVSANSAYRHKVLNALPDCTVTQNIVDVAAFIKKKKSADYFI
jgi:Rad3-related DNA helicase